MGAADRRLPGRLAGVLAASVLLTAGCSLWRGNAPGQVQVGTASWYGAELQGRRTASGERFDEGAFTAASPSLPIGTRVRVTNLANGRSAVVRINDRGPFGRGRVLDVSYAAARALGMVGSGTARVRIETLGDGPARVTTSRARWRRAPPPATAGATGAPEGDTPP
jgi:rare lipoprotein A